MVGAIKVASGVDGLSINFGVEKLSLIVLLVMSRKRWRRHVHGHLSMSRFVNEPRLVGMDLGVELDVLTVPGSNDLDLPEDGNCVDVTEWSECPWTRMNIEDHQYQSLYLCDVEMKVADAMA